MKILEYTLGLPPFRRGGLPRYSTDLSEELAKENRVYLMYPGQINPYSKKIKLTKKHTKYSFETIEMKNPLPVSLGLGIKDEKYYMEKRDIKALEEFVKEIKPDVVHFHTLMGMPKDFLEYLHRKNIRMIYTTHDFYGLCPKMLSKNPKRELTNPRCSYDCMMCNIGPSYKKIVIMQAPLYETLKESKLIKKLRSKDKNNISQNNDSVILSLKEAELRYKLRKYYLKMFNLIDVFHFNSSVAEEYFKKFLPTSYGKVVNITHKNLKIYKKSRKIKKSNIVIGYVGPYDNKKGFYKLIKILCELRSNKYTNFEFHACGDVKNMSIFNKKWAFNHKVLTSSKMNSFYNKIDILIMPSLWHETFGFSVLEGLSHDDICIVSNNVGAKDLVAPDLIFNTTHELILKLEKILSTNSQELTKLQNMSRSKTLPIDFASHCREIKDTFYR